MPAQRPKTTAGVIRLSEATGSSSRGWEDAVAAAVKASDVKTPVGVEVARLWADWDRGKLGRDRQHVGRATSADDTVGQSLNDQ